MMNKLEVLQTYHRSYEAARHEEAQERYARVIHCLLQGRSLWQEYEERKALSTGYLSRSASGISEA